MEAEGPDVRERTGDCNPLRRQLRLVRLHDCGLPAPPGRCCGSCVTTWFEAGYDLASSFPGRRPQERRRVLQTIADCAERDPDCWACAWAIRPWASPCSARPWGTHPGSCGKTSVITRRARRVRRRPPRR